jgi:hypothetical protein
MFIIQYNDNIRIKKIISCDVQKLEKKYRQIIIRISNN